MTTVDGNRASFPQPTYAWTRREYEAFVARTGRTPDSPHRTKHGNTHGTQH